MLATYDRQTIFSRMPELVNFDDIERLETKTVAIPGSGGVGFTAAECVVRMGVGRVRISDFDTFGPENVSRQLGATSMTMGRKKVEVLAERLHAINPRLEVEASGGVGPQMIGQFLDGVDIVCDAIDFFAVGPRRMLHKEARKRGIPLVFSAPSAFGCTTQILDTTGPSLDEFFDMSDEQTDEQNLANFAIGINPARLSRHYHRAPHLGVGKRGAVSSGCLLASALTGTVVLRRLLGEKLVLKPLPYLYAVDFVLGKFVEMHIPGGVKAIKANPEKYLQ
jgi:molybdopterin/thiamine biosynthesis adenylyltransferase